MARLPLLTSHLLVLSAGITIWGRFDTNYVAGVQPLSIYLSKTPDFTLGLPVVLNRPWPLQTSRRPFTFVWNTTIQDALFITIFRNTTSADRYLALTEVQPLRYGGWAHVCAVCP